MLRVCSQTIVKLHYVIYVTKERQDKTASIHTWVLAGVVADWLVACDVVAKRKRNDTITIIIIMLLLAEKVSYERICQDRLGTYCRVGLIWPDQI